MVHKLEHMLLFIMCIYEDFAINNYLAKYISRYRHKILANLIQVFHRIMVTISAGFYGLLDDVFRFEYFAKQGICNFLFINLATDFHSSFNLVLLIPAINNAHIPSISFPPHHPPDLNSWHLKFQIDPIVELYIHCPILSHSHDIIWRASTHYEFESSKYTSIWIHDQESCNWRMMAHMLRIYISILSNLGFKSLTKNWVKWFQLTAASW